MIDQLMIGDKASFDDFSASVAARVIGTPPKKTIKETVPFSNTTYDFSKINGELYWEERPLEYIFELTAHTPEELEELKAAFAAWVMAVMNEQLFDPFIPDYHFLATYDEMNFEDDEGMDKTTATVTFTAYPYKIANVAKVYEATLPSSGQVRIEVLNESTHPVSLTVANTTGITIKIGEALTAPLSSGEGTYGALKLPSGLVPVVLTNSEAREGAVRISFYEEVF